MKFTLEIYKMDRRTKEGQRLVGKYDYDRADKAAMEREIAALFPTYRKRDGYIFNVVETYREVTNMITGKTLLERYDTPYACSVASDAYWQN
jgi:hypothetical protein